MRILAAALGTILIGGCGVDRVQPDAETLDNLSIYDCPVATGTYEPAEIPNLISSPERLDGKAIKISGYYYSGFEHAGIYAEPQDPEKLYASDFTKGIWTLGADQKLSGKFVTLRGVYDAKGHGHLGQWPGTICVYSTTLGNES